MTADFELIRIASGKNRSALRLAELSHRGVKRKGEPYAYITHVATVGDLMAGAGGDRNHIVACYLHDTVEDTDHLPILEIGTKDKHGDYIPRQITLEEIEQEFGLTVRLHVEAVTKTAADKKLPPAEQTDVVFSKLMKAEHKFYQLIQDFNEEKKAKALQDQGSFLSVKACDLLANISDLVLDVELKGLSFFHTMYGENKAEAKVKHYIDLSNLIISQLYNYPRWKRLAEALEFRVEELEDLASQFFPNF